MLVLPYERKEALVGGDDDAIAADDKPFNRGVGKTTHPGIFARGPRALPQIEEDAAKGEGQDEDADNGDDQRQPGGRSLAAGDHREAVAEIRGAHGREVHRADGERQQPRPCNAVAYGLAPARPHQQREGRENRAQDDRGDNEIRRPDNAATTMASMPT